ncbi:MAG: sigma 54-interacting transcriptional regulator [Pseudonocardiaceae bacterium]
MSDRRLACTIHPIGASDAALVASVRQELIGRGVFIRDTPSGVATSTALSVCVNPDESALAIVARLAEQCRRVLVVVGAPVTAPGLIWRLLAHGASDVLSWQPRYEPGAAVLRRLQRWSHIDETLNTPLVRNQLIGQSSAWLAALRRVVEVACFTTSSLLLEGESGTGKELVARLFHHLDPRKVKRDLIVVDCTTIVPTLSGSEFFGHERGAFTGAMSAREGAFAAADRGTLFLDEIGELPLTMQAELLRVIQEGTYKRVGADQWRKTSFRLVCATNRNLAAELAAGRFRLDLLHRLATNVVQLPPLRERAGDVLPLFACFLAEAVGTELELHPAVVELLQQRDYPGNVRDLRQLALRVAVRYVGPGPVTPGDLPEEERPTGHAPSREHSATGLLDQAVAAALRAGRGYREIRDAAADTAVRLAVEWAGGNLQAAAQRLGVTDRMVQQQQRAVSRNGVPLPEPRVTAGTADG